MNATTIPMSLIQINYEFNVRSRTGKKGEEHYRGIESLAADIKRDGQLTPVIVRKAKDGSGYQLIAGFRRHEAMKLNGATEIDAQVLDLDDAKAAIINAKENVARDSLTSYDLARRFVELRDRYNLSQAKIAAEFAAGTDYQGEGMSRSYVGNLMRAFDNLHPKIKDAWKNEDPSLNLVQLIKWGAMEDQDEQMEEWDELRDVTGDEEGEGGEEGESGTASNEKSTPRKASTSHLVAAFRAMNNDPKVTESQNDAMTAVFQFALGKKKTLSIGAHLIYDPKAKKEKVKKAKKVEKQTADEE